MGQTIRIQATKVLQKTLDAEHAGFKIICHEGGSRSSKTWSIFQFFILKALAGDQLVVTIVRNKLSWIKSTLLDDFSQITKAYGITVTPEININRQEQIYTVNGTEFAFFGLDYTEKLHGRSQDWFWMNETMECSRREFDQLEMRTRVGGVLDYNPANDEHWVFDLSRRPDVIFIKSTMLDNPFLPKTILDKIRSYEPTEQNIQNGTADSYMWEVYGLGNRARLQGVVFEKWDVCDLPEAAKFIAYGLDFGYTNHPSALVGLFVCDNELYFKEYIYQNGLTNQDLGEHMRGTGVQKKDNIYCDSAEPKSIDELHLMGFNTQGVVKGADSINYGIDLMKGFTMHVVSGSNNLESELRKYKWAEDRIGTRLNKPVDVFNHAIDAARYVTIMTMGSQKEPVATIDVYS